MVKLDRRFKQGNLVKQMPSEKLDWIGGDLECGQHLL
jgi:hypothetical protein